MGCNCFQLLKVMLPVALLLLVLEPSPAVLAPTVSKREANCTPSNPSLDAFNGITVTLLYTNMRPEFASSEGSGEDSAVADGMCDLLAYHDIMDTPPAPLNTTNTTSSPDNTTQSLLALLRLNLEDTCTWLRQLEGASGGEGTSGGANFMASPTTCDLDHLRLFCLSRRLVAIELSAKTAIEESIYNTYNEGSPMAIQLGLCQWIDRKVSTDVRTELDSIGLC